VVPSGPATRSSECVHPKNRGYGGNQKTCYRLALAAGADVVIMLHPDYQYTPTLIPAMASMVTSGLYPCVLASRILGGGALRGGMPVRVGGKVVGAVGVAGLSKEIDAEIAKTAAAAVSPSPKTLPHD